MARVHLASRTAALIFCVALLVPGSLSAQETDRKLSEIVPNMYLESALVEALAFAEVLFPFLSPQDRREIGLGIFAEQAGPQLETALVMNQLMGAQVSSFPLGSSAGGFSWTFDPALGAFNRVSPSFGPVFSERALTIGRRRLNVGVNYQRATFDSLEGKDLRGGDIKFYTGFDFGAFSIFFEDSLDLKISTDTVGLFATYGVTDRLDLGIAVPIMKVRMRAALTSRVGSNVTGVNPDALTPRVVNDSANGIGDIVLRGKYNFWKARGGGLAAGVDWRLPTGDEEELLGIAGAQGKIYIAASSAYGRVSPHFNAGLTISGDTAAARSLETAVFDPPDEVNYAGGVDVAITPRLTVVGDVVGRTLRSTDRFNLRLVDHAESNFGSNLREWASEPGSLKVLLGSVGVKFNPASRALFAFNLLFPLNDRGLRDDLTFVGGFEWSF